MRPTQGDWIPIREHPSNSSDIAHQMAQQALHSDSSEADSDDDMVTRLSLKTRKYGVADIRSEHWIDVLVNGVRLRAFPDSGSAFNLMSEQYAYDNKLHIKDRAKRVLRLLNGKFVDPVGDVDIKFRFADEEKALSLTFTVLAGCIHDLVLSGPFLWATQTFAKFKSQIYSLPISYPAVRIGFHGTSHQQVVGSLNDYPVTAIVDTCADVNVITESFAMTFGLKVSPYREATALEFIDGSRVTVRRIAHGVAWKYGQASTKAKPFLYEPKVFEFTAFTAVSAERPLDWKFGTNKERRHFHV